MVCCFSPFTGQKPKVSENDFEDLLSKQGFSAKSDKKGPKTIAEMRKQEMSKDMDPLKLKVGLKLVLICDNVSIWIKAADNRANGFSD